MALPITILFGAAARTWLLKLFAWVAAGLAVRMLIGAGFSYFVFGWISEWVDGYIALARAAVPTGLGVALDLLAMGGFGVAINLVGSAMIGGAGIYVAVNAYRIVLSAAGVAGALNKQKAFWGE